MSAADATNVATNTILSFDPDQLRQWCDDQGFGGYRAQQIRKRIFSGRATDFDEMKELPAKAREALKSEFALFTSKIVDHRIASDRTEKLLLELPDKQLVECVLMRETNRRTACISTQVGCAMGCVFCASGLLGVKRNLTSAEILEQLLRIDRLLEPGERLSNIVVMGIGEPLANLKSLIPALEEVHREDGLALGARRITISTVGLPAQMRELAEKPHQWNLAVSLHAPNDELRTKLVPVNKSTGIKEILAAADEYFDKTGRRVTYEYVLLGGINDEAEHAKELAGLLSRRNAHVNLIPMNGVTELPFGAPTEPGTQQFRAILEQNGVPTTVRKRKGADIDAACGQLRLNREQESQGNALPVIQ
ncbi:23S rRNA (adenine(2503)-C(2))-methyltransferase RlmN [Calycomorphotria hydatis]|uniref:Probable dual-specificity RNA methyltransferase RlmN n=1 Tax=Calycomorphotria hydatis TaxID=2528027 RepID=A0A517TCC6_9PLAN|nr:23S rRNA (adenine(2503)-C(2))-methyltransferase RlmN [Calycomorphotria hydatis]QDT66032.1 putative dual-specificity RNA methyltransferase RlmN [Calycomorphotria hydatis]